MEPDKSEILPLWRFKTPEIAEESFAAVLAMFDTYLDAGDGVGMDMARTFLQMGRTRARRYVNRRGDWKYDPATGAQLPCEIDPVTRPRRPPSSNAATSGPWPTLLT